MVSLQGWPWAFLPSPSPFPAKGDAAKPDRRSFVPSRPSLSDTLSGLLALDHQVLARSLPPTLVSSWLLQWLVQRKKKRRHLRAPRVHIQSRLPLRPASLQPSVPRLPLRDRWGLPSLRGRCFIQPDLLDSLVSRNDQLTLESISLGSPSLLSSLSLPPSLPLPHRRWRALRLLPRLPPPAFVVVASVILLLAQLSSNPRNQEPASFVLTPQLDD